MGATNTLRQIGQRPGIKEMFGQGGDEPDWEGIDTPPVDTQSPANISTTSAAPSDTSATEGAEGAGVAAARPQRGAGSASPKKKKKGLRLRVGGY